MVAPILAQVGVPVLTEILRGSLEKIDNSVAAKAAEALSGLDDLILSGSLSQEEMAEANRHAEIMAQIRSQEAAEALSSNN
jgi:hypothetical protein